VPTCKCCPRPTERRSRFCWLTGCPCFAWCDGCERAPALPGFPVCGPCALELARDPPARLRVYAPPPRLGGRAADTDKLARGAVIDFRPGHGRARFRARVQVGRRRVVVGLFQTEADARAAVRAFNEQRRAA
jgi:hypothetical protein